MVLVDPDPRDRSDGTLWDGLHTALRGRGKVEPINHQQVNHQPINHPAAVVPVVPVKGGNGGHGSAKPDLTTRRFAPVQPHLMKNGNGHGDKAAEPGLHDLPTKRFAPVRTDEPDELVQRGNQG